MNVNVLLPAAGCTIVNSLCISPSPTGIELGRSCSNHSSTCPKCGTPSRRVHSRYPRTLHDLPWGGTPMVLRFQTRRFFCDNAGCGRTIFAEQLPALAALRAWGTPRFDRALVQIGLKCGEPGHRLAGKMGISPWKRRCRTREYSPVLTNHRSIILGNRNFSTAY